MKIIYALLLLLPSLASAQGIELLTMESGQDGGASFSTSISAILFTVVLAMIPTIFITMTPFLRITIVLSLMRQALGLNTTPSNKVIASMALVVTIFIMAPVLEVVNEKAIQPLQAGDITTEQAVIEGAKPLRSFMLNQTRVEHLEKFVKMSGSEFTTKEEVEFHVIVAAFITSEIQTALKIGFFIFLPFIIIDLVVSSVLMSMGMMMVSPMIISLPFKIVLFVAVDGWLLIVDGLASSFFLGGIM